MRISSELVEVNASTSFFASAVVEYGGHGNQGVDKLIPPVGDIIDLQGDERMRVLERKFLR